MVAYGLSGTTVNNFFPLPTGVTSAHGAMGTGSGGASEEAAKAPSLTPNHSHLRAILGPSQHQCLQHLHRHTVSQSTLNLTWEDTHTQAGTRVQTYTQVRSQHPKRPEWHACLP